MALAAAVPRLVRHEAVNRWIQKYSWSPRDLLTGDLFPTTSALTVKRSRTSRFFMYEEHASEKQRDEKGRTEEIQQSSAQLADLLCATKNANHYYWTSPVADVAPALRHRLTGYETLYDNQRRHLLDPRGPSLWMATSGSATQAHYDVADNVMVVLHGTKRVQCYPPQAARALHVFSDAHPRARKSQVNFDDPDYTRYPQYASLQPPALDVVMKAGDVLHIPAFWFHHVENGRLLDYNEDVTDGPSVSVNLFAMSDAMIAGQSIFQSASRPLGFMTAAAGTDAAAVQAHSEFSIAALRALGFGLIRGLGFGSPREVIREHLLETRFGPQRTQQHCSVRKLTASEQELCNACIERVLPKFDAFSHDNGISMLIACHLMELWAVEFVGADYVAEMWEAAVQEDEV
jgi:hypothetical protein